MQPANCGFEVDAWSPLLREKFAGAPLKTVALRLDDEPPRPGEFVLTAGGVEGSLVYALSARIRQRIARDGSATVHLDLLPNHPPEKVIKALAATRRALHGQAPARPAGYRRGQGRPVARAHPAEVFTDPERLAAAIKALPITLVRPRPLDEAISSAGGVPFEALDENLMLKALPGLFCAGEMLDWEAPPGLPAHRLLRQRPPRRARHAGVAGRRRPLIQAGSGWAMPRSAALCSRRVSRKRCSTAESSPAR